MAARVDRNPARSPRSPVSVGPGSSPTPEPGKTARPEPAESPLTRLAIPLGSDGKVAVDRMRQGTRDQLAAMLKDGDLARSLGVAPAETTAVIPPQLIAPVINALSQIEMIVVSRLTHAPADLVIKIAAYTPEEKDMLAEPVATVLNKYGGKVLGKWGDEVTLAVLLISLTASKVAAIQDAMRMPGTVRPFVVPVSDAPRDESASASGDGE